MAGRIAPVILSPVLAKAIPRDAPVLKITGRLSLGGSKALLVVEAGGQSFLVAANSESVSAIQPLPHAPCVAEDWRGPGRGTDVGP